MKEGRILRKTTFERKRTLKEITKESFTNKAIEILNILPDELLAIDDKEIFKNSLKKWIIKEIPIKPT